MNILTFVLCFCIAIIAYVYYAFKKSFSYWKYRDVPYAEPNFPFGNVPVKSMDFNEMILTTYKSKKTLFPFMGIYIFKTPTVLATDLDFLQHVLIKDFNSFASRGLYVNESGDPLSAHLLALDGEKWKSLRAKLSPTFTSGKMKYMFPTILEVANRFNLSLAATLDVPGEVELKEWLSKFTTDVIGTCAFGIECNNLQGQQYEFRRYGERYFRDPFMGPFVQFLAIQYPTVARMLNVRVLQKDVSEFFLDMVRQIVDNREKNNIRRNDLMDLLIQLKNDDNAVDEHSQVLGKLTLEEIAAQGAFFFVGGFDTTSTAMVCVLYELAVNPDIQEKVRNEIIETISAYNGNVTYEAVKVMVYLDQVLSGKNYTLAARCCNITLIIDSHGCKKPDLFS